MIKVIDALNSKLIAQKSLRDWNISSLIRHFSFS